MTWLGTTLQEQWKDDTYLGGVLCPKLALKHVRVVTYVSEAHLHMPLVPTYSHFGSDYHVFLCLDARQHDH